MRDRAQRGFADAGAFDKDFKGATIAFMSDLAVKKVEAQIALFGGISLARDEADHRIRIDEAADQPTAFDAIDMRPCV